MTILYIGEVMQEVFEAARECDVAVEATVLDETKRLLQLFVADVDSRGLSCDSPSAGTESDRSVTLELYASPNWIFSVSVSPDGMLHYAGLFGKESESGCRAFQGRAELPEFVARLAADVKMGRK